MKITLDEWLELEQLAREAGAALDQLRQRITKTWARHHDAGDTREASLLRDAETRVTEAKSQLATYLFHVQSEWTGGCSDNPRNFTLREPNLVTISHSFPCEQVAKYRLPDGDICIPHRGGLPQRYAGQLEWHDGWRQIRSDKQQPEERADG